MFLFYIPNFNSYWDTLKDEESIKPHVSANLKPFSQDKLNNLIRKFGIPKDAADILGKEKTYYIEEQITFSISL